MEQLERNIYDVYFAIAVAAGFVGVTLAAGLTIALGIWVHNRTTKD